MPRRLSTERAEPATVVAFQKPVRQKNPAAVALGKLGGSKGGTIRAAKLTTEQKKAIARQGAQARWAKALYGQDRLVMPPVGGAGDVKPPDGDSPKDPEDKSKRSGGNGGNGGRHQLIEGLITTLPSEGSEWSTEDRASWLQGAAAIFNLIYKSSGRNQRLKIEIQDSAK